MAIETVFLIVLIVSLVIGNALLSVFSPARPSAFLGQREIESDQPKMQENPLGFAEQKSPPDQKLFLLSRQISLLDQKISRLETFRQNTQVEMKGMVELLLDLEKIVKKKGKRTFKEKNLSKEQMHKIIYRSG